MSDNVEKNEFLSSVSHEIRTSLNTIVGLSEDIGGYEAIPEEISEDAEDLIAASKSLLEFVDNILDYVMIEKNEMKIVNTHYNPTELFEKIAKQDEEYIEDKPIDFHTNIDSNLPFELTGDKNHIEKITNNLITNAIKYTDGGDIWFDVSCINDGEDCSLIINVKDTGRGMTLEEIDKLFEKIDKLNIRRDTSNEGIGLGLAITKSLVDMMGGQINVISDYGKGSSFEVIIPQKIHLMEESDISKTQRMRLQEINYEKEGYGYKKVLIVDDNQLNIKVARRFLEQYDLVIEECYNGQECIDLLTEDPSYDLILMDIMMPGLSGEETLRRLNEIEGFDTPVVAVTAEAEPGAQEMYESKGFAGYLAKPFSKTQIESKLDEVFKQKELQEEDQWF